jgi:hypothetical protein
MEHNSDYKYDLKIGIAKEEELAQILGDGATVEVKYDRYDNDRFFIEYMFDDGTKSYPTGISTTQAKYYALAKENYYLIISVERLKTILRAYAKKYKPVKGGDSNTATGYLIPLSTLTH